jgi:DNA polymerase I-like protein with 3'-5' exonuclease and polymerase domains
MLPARIEVVRTSDQFRQFLYWLRDHDGRYVAVDTETSDANLLHTPEFRIRLIQVGDTQDAWVFPWHLWGTAVGQSLREFHGRILIHNSDFDMTAMLLQAIDLDWSRVIDTFLAMRIAEPSELSGLKESCNRHIDPDANLTQKDLHDAMSRNGWTWDTIPIDLPLFLNYAGWDVVLTSRLYELQIVQDAIVSPTWQLEMDTAKVCARMAMRGMKVDTELCDVKRTVLRKESGRMRGEMLEDFGLDIGSTKACSHWFIEDPDAFPLMTKKTKGGSISVDKEVVEKISVSIPGTRAEHVAKTMVAVRYKEKLAASYFDTFIDRADANGLVHSQILTSEAKTGRMCVPDSHLLLTRRGLLTPDQIQIGDETIGLTGGWTRVEAVYRYADQPIEVREHSTYRLEATAEHRWVTTSDRGVLRVEPLDGSRRHVHLAPLTDMERFNPATSDWDIRTEQERLAAIVGLLVTDGRCIPEGGLRAHIYQTEKKFYAQIRALLPADAVMYDRLTTEDHHEIRLRTKWLRPRLEADGLDLNSGLLKNSPSLIPWVLSLSPRETLQFLTSVWLADGRTGYPKSPTISCGSPVLQEAIRIAAYRCGWTTSVLHAGPGQWSTKDRQIISLRKPKVITRKMTVSQARSDVWCVSTETGTMTAWSPGHGPYLTGNSIRNPALQTLAKGDAAGVRAVVLPRNSGELLISSDYDQIEMRLAAIFSRDPVLMQTFRDADASGGDFFTAMGQQIYHDLAFTKSDPRRGTIKSTMYGMLYGAGAVKIALTAKITAAEARSSMSEIFTAYPGLRTLMDSTERRAKREGQVTTLGGRVLTVHPQAAYKGLNYLIQGSGAVLLKRALVELACAGLEDYLVAPVHDEVLFSVPKDEVEDVRRVVSQIMPITDLPLLIGAKPSPGLINWGADVK